MIVYRVKCLITHKVYIGQTSKSLDRRKREHIRAANVGSNYTFHRAIRKYSEKHFTWEVMRYDINKDEADALEKALISLNPNNYNMTAGGGGILGFQHSQLTKNKISKSNKGKNKGKTTWIAGKTHPKDIKDNIALKLGGKPFCVFKDNEFIGEWINQAECARELKLIKGHISNCLSGIRQSHHGYTFRYK